MSKYLINFSKSEARAVLEYDENGYLLQYALEPGAFETAQFDFLTRFFPKSEPLLQEWIKSSYQNVSITKIDEDLSFERFYNAYDHKVSKRSKAENVWNKMTDANKILAIKHIPKYEAYLRKTGINKRYPEVYLNSEIWNN